MDRFEQMRVFVAVAEKAGFAAAARQLNVSPPVVTRAVAALESDLGVQLFRRTTRSVRLTESGERYLEDTRQILEAVQLADDAAAGINAAPRGHIAVTAPVMFGRKFVTSGVVKYLQQYPDTQVSTMFVDRVVSLVEEGLDVGVRIGNLPDSSMRAIRVGQLRSVVVASPKYLKQRGTPRTPQALSDHRLIVSSAGDFSLSWAFAADSQIKINPCLMTTTNDSAIEAALQHFGVTRLLSYQVADEVREGRLKRILRKYEVAPLPVHIVHREGRLSSSRIRAFIDLLAEHLKSEIKGLD